MSKILEWKAASLSELSTDQHESHLRPGANQEYKVCDSEGLKILCMLHFSGKADLAAR